MSEHSESKPAGAPEGPPRPLVIACLILGLEALGLVVVAGVAVAHAGSAAHHHVLRAVLGGGFALVGAGALGLCARGLLRLRPAARTPVVVLQLLILPVSYTIAFQADQPAYGGPMLLAALAVIYLLFTPPVRAVLDREDPLG
ncbi:MAG: hypothetical protein ABR571_01265 [Jatrophihabitans sp.]|uniref:hypothetical protein n=1 Tax=Jatrophihabitans sp. TaxID=1932789 RepID=UPI00390E19AF